jgi:hypothetical protein
MATVAPLKWASPMAGSKLIVLVKGGLHLNQIVIRSDRKLWRDEIVHNLSDMGAKLWKLHRIM